MSTLAVTNSNRSPKTIALWVVQVALAAMFVMAGYGKLSGDPQMVGLFQALGLGQWFRYFTGGIEVVSALLLLIPATAGLGASLLFGTMIGAVATHLFVVGGSFAPAAVFLVLSGIVAWVRRYQTLRLIGVKENE